MAIDITLNYIIYYARPAAVHHLFNTYFTCWYYAFFYNYYCVLTFWRLVFITTHNQFRHSCQCCCSNTTIKYTQNLRWPFKTYIMLLRHFRGMFTTLTFAVVYYFRGPTLSKFPFFFQNRDEPHMLCFVLTSDVFRSWSYYIIILTYHNCTQKIYDLYNRHNSWYICTYYIDCDM